MGKRILSLTLALLLAFSLLYVAPLTASADGIGGSDPILTGSAGIDIFINPGEGSTVSTQELYQELKAELEGRGLIEGTDFRIRMPSST